MKKKILVTALSVAMVLSAGACGSGNGQPADGASSADNASSANAASDDLNNLESIELSYAHMGSESSMVGQWGKLFKSKLEAASNGKITVNIFSNNEMGTDAEAVEAILDNTIQIAGMQPSPLVAFVPAAAVFDLPCAFASADAETINTVLNHSEFSETLGTKFEDSGLKCLGFTQGATFRELTSNVDVKSVDDLKGLNMRVMDNSYQIQFWGALGCNTTPVPGSELYMSLQNGLVDSQENALDTLVVMGAPEVQKYVVMTNHSLYTNLMVMSKSYFESLPAEYQQLIEQVIAETEEEMISIYSEANNEARKTLEESGMIINEFDDAQFAKMIELAQPVYDSVRENVGNEIVDSLLNAIQ